MEIEGYTFAELNWEISYDYRRGRLEEGFASRLGINSSKSLHILTANLWQLRHDGNYAVIPQLGTRDH